MHNLHEKLRHIIEKHGLDLAMSPKLCDAFLSDLLWEYKQERKLLLQGVIVGISKSILDGKKPSTLDQKQREFFASDAEYKWTIDTWSYALTEQHVANSQPKPHNKNRKLIFSIAGALLTLALGFLIFTTLQPNITSEKESDTKQVAAANPQPQAQTNEKALLSMRQTLIGRETAISIQEAIMSSISVGHASQLLFQKQQGLDSLNELLKINNDEFYKAQKLTITRQLENLKKDIDRMSNEYQQKLGIVCNIQDDYTNKALESLPANYTNSTGLEKQAATLFIKHVEGCQAADKTALNKFLKSASTSLENDYIDFFNKERRSSDDEIK